jgi:hypothetical protein
LLVASLAGAQQTAAQSASGCDGAEYREGIRNAVEEFERGNWAEAKLFFSDAHKLCPSARTLRGLGLVAYELRDYVSASDLLAEALASAVRPLSPEMRQPTQQVLDQSRRFEGRLEVALTPSNALFKIDDEAALRAASGPVRLNPGPHRITASLGGFGDETRQVNIEAGGLTRLAIVLRRTLVVEQQPAPARTAEEPRDDGPGLGTQKILALVAGGVGIVGIGVGTAFGIMTLSNHAEAEKYCNGAECTDVRGIEAGNDAHTTGTVSTVAMIVGIAGLAGAATLWFTAPSEETRAGLAIGPGAVQLGGVF